MRNGFLSLLILAAAALPASSANAGSARHVVVIVWDGMRPDFVTEQYTPTLWQLAQRGVTFQNHHSVYLSSTEVNGTAISTGAYPSHDGIVGNKEYRPEIDPLKPVHTEDFDAVRNGDKATHGHYELMPTLAEIIRKAGGRTAVAGAKPVVMLVDRGDRSNARMGANLVAGQTIPTDLLQTLVRLHGDFPKAGATDPSRNDWTTDSLLDPLWAAGVPDFSLLWMNEPDLTQHLTGPGSTSSLAAIRQADDNLAKVLRALEAKGARDSTDVFVVSDHGFSTVSALVDLADSLEKAGFRASREFTAKPAKGQIMVVSNSGSSLIYVIGHDEQVIRGVVAFLQAWSHTGVIFTRKPMPGVFTLDQVRLDSPAAPDILVSMRWTPDKNEAGVPGQVESDFSEYGPGQGTHVTLSRFDMHNTLIAAGPDFRPGVNSSLASGNVDIAPTALWVLGRKKIPKNMDGRVLTEALTISGPKLKSFEPGHVEATNAVEKSVWHQYLNFTRVNDTSYYDEGNGYQTPR
jgi:arylsulfatase A-like enzyme